MKSNYIKLAALWLVVAVFFGCEKHLDRKPLDQASSSTFLSNEAEMDQGLTGVYASAMWVFPNNTPLLFALESSTDHAIKRGGNAEDLVALGEAGPFAINNSLVNTFWSQAYKLVQRANQQLAGMENGKANVSITTFNRMRAEALVLRAWGYFHLMYLFGDIPFYKTPPGVDEILNATRTPVATIVPELYKDLDEAIAAFDAANAAPILANGKVNKGVALGLKAKLALMVKDFATAAAATKTIIDGGQYALNPSYTNLFMYNGQTANTGREIMFNQTYPNDVLDPQNWLMVISIPRQVTQSQSSHFPSQQLVDKYEGRDGKRIDASAVYDPANPRLNRDRRLGWTIYMPGDTMIHNVGKAPSGNYIEPRQRTIFNIYSNIRRQYNWKTNQFDNITGNNDWVGAQAAGIQWQVSATGSIGGVGYVWRKYQDSTQYAWETKTGYILMRYADILLMYAESKIEQNQLDQSVLDAINLVRTRAGQPAAVLGSQAEMRQLVRRERAVEFGGEGIRLFDLRRWDIYAKANSGPVVGAAVSETVVPATPVFDINDLPDYSASLAERIKFRNQTRNNANPRYKLWPIPQFERDVNNKITQNEGW